MSLLPSQIIPASMPIGKLSPDGKSVLIDQNWWLFIYNVYLNSVKADVAGGFLKSFNGRNASAVIPARGDYTLAMLGDVNPGSWQDTYALVYSATAKQWQARPGGTLTSVSVVNANGLTGTITMPFTTPAITLSTTATGVLKGAAGVIEPAVVGTDFSLGTSVLGTGIVKTTTGTGALSVAVPADFPILNQNTTGSAGSLSPGAQINGVAFTGASNITVAAAAGTLTGTTLASNVTASSLTSVGTLAALTVTATIVGSVNGNAATVTTNANLTGPITSVGNATSVTANAITNAMLAEMATLTIKGNNGGSTANAVDLTVAQVNAILPVFTSSLNGLAPSSGGGTTNFLRADGTWSAPPGGGTSFVGSTVTVVSTPSTKAWTTYTVNAAAKFVFIIVNITWSAASANDYLQVQVRETGTTASYTICTLYAFAASSGFETQSTSIVACDSSGRFDYEIVGSGGYTGGNVSIQTLAYIT